VKRLIAILLCLLAASANAQTATKPITLPFGVKRAELGGYVLLRSGLIWGKGDGGQTIVRPLPGDTAPVVSSADIAKWKASGKGQYAYEGVPTGVIVRDFVIDGQDRVFPNPHLWDKRPRGRSAIDLWSPGARVERVKVHDHDGVGLEMGHGAAVMDGWTQPTDAAVMRIQGFRTDRTHAGVWVTSSADGLADDIDVNDGRDFGARFDGAAWLISRVHAAGFLAKATAEDPDLGVGIISGPNGANYFLNGIQPDNCRIGFRNYGHATSVEQLLGKLCSEITVHAVAPTIITRCQIETPGGRTWMPHFNPAPRGVVIEPTAAGSIIGDEHSIVTTNDATAAVMYEVKASRCVVQNARKSWGGGGKANGNTLIEYGSPTEKLWGGTYDVWASGFGTGIKLTHPIGKGNTFIVHHDGNCATPIDVGPNKDLSGNDVRIEDASAWGGSWTVLATKGDAQ
jgi:hypothetical protein